MDCDLVGGGLTAKCDVIVRRKIGQILQREGLITEMQLNEALELAHGSRRRLGEILMDLGYLGESDLNQAVMTQDVEPIGILDALSGEDLEACVTSAGVDGLSVLPLGTRAYACGPPRSRRAKAVSGRAMPRRVLMLC